MIWFVHALELYLGIGFLFALAFVARGAAAIDPAAREGSLGFRALILPGATALWPFLARAWWRARAARGQERAA